jgi:hypothetical protein
MPTVEIQGVGRVQFPDEMSPEQITSAIETDILPKQQGTQQSQTGLPRQAALTGRAVGEGVFGTILQGAESFAGLGSGRAIQDEALRRATGRNKLQLEIADFNSRFGTDIPEAASFSELLSGLLTKAGAPVPETGGERLGFAGVKGAASALTGAPVGAPLMAAASGASGGVASEFVRQEGGGTGAQLAAGIVGGMSPYTIVEGGKAIARGGRALLEPFMESGRKQVVGRTLNAVADDPAAAQANMAAAREIVPGSQPTAAEVSKDYGIIQAQRTAKASNPSEFANRASEQNTARQQFLGVAAKDQAALSKLVDRREQVTTKLRDAAFKQAQGKVVDNQALLQKIDSLIADPDNAGETTQKALQWARSQIEGKGDPRALYAVRKDIAMKIAGKVSADESVLRYAGKELSEVRNLIDDGIQAIAPAWKQYLVKYRQLSRPIDRMSALQEAQSKASFAPSDALSGREVLTQAKWKSQVRSLLDNADLTKGQQARIQRIADDLDRGMAINDPNIRAIGSNTTQDMTAANVLGQALGSTKMAPLVRSLARPLQWVYKIPEDEMQKLLSDALLDPKLGAELMKNASGAQMAKVSALLRRRFLASGLGTSAAAATQTRSVSENTEE